MSGNTAKVSEDAVLIQWSKDLSVGIEEIDEQHKVLVNLLNQLHDAIIHQHGSEVTKAILQELLEYTRVHFAVEESIMRILGYPDYEEHKRHHKQLLDEVRLLGEKVAGGKKAIGFELLHFLKVWLTKHIMEEDKLYVPFFLSKGVKKSHAKGSWITRFWG